MINPKVRDYLAKQLSYCNGPTTEGSTFVDEVVGAVDRDTLCGSYDFFRSYRPKKMVDGLEFLAEDFDATQFAVYEDISFENFRRKSKIRAIHHGIGALASLATIALSSKAGFDLDSPLITFLGVSAGTIGLVNFGTYLLESYQEVKAFDELAVQLRRLRKMTYENAIKLNEKLYGRKK